MSDKKFRPVALSISEGFDDEIAPNTENHHMVFFGVCCDFRRAVLTVNIISVAKGIILLLITLLGAVALESAADNAAAEAQDDAVGGEGAGGLFLLFGGILMLMEIIPVVFAAIGIYGAVKFKQWAVITAACAHAFVLLMSLISFDPDLPGLSFVQMAIPAIWLYPHVFMIHHMRLGIMTPSNYANINKCCC
jgi:hypothetical protein